ncbi:AAA family ATPase [Lujinxingia vulgaris]|uniref:AAA family ATPase n=1 Tax=Lujinxingia vulgaris TaxID=2600176 RepID=A0A5C6WYG8_9DELT|nr:AAA family ATPase [Lujinxingia vulgaris]TXD33801.1 AAA family ATPase [Lujinxingia vulgaris]
MGVDEAVADKEVEASFNEVENAESGSGPAAPNQNPEGRGGEWDETAAYASEIRDKVTNRIHEGLKSLHGKEVVCFGWRYRSDGSPNKLVFKLVSREGQQDKKRIELVMYQPDSHGTLQKVDVRVETWTFTHVNNNKEDGVLRLVGNPSHIDCFEYEYLDKVRTSNEAWKVGDEREVKIPRPRGFRQPEYFAQVWHRSKEEKSKAQALSPEVEKDPSVEFFPNGLGAKMHKYWPTYKRKSNQWYTRVPHPDADPEDWACLLLVTMIWRVAVSYHSGNGANIPQDQTLEFPDEESYTPRRAVDLSPGLVSGELAKAGLRLPWHVVEAACAALNSGKNIILTGPPGCGKSKFAIQLARLARSKEPLVATASPAWSTGDLLGRYMPDNRNGKGLMFQPGFFLRALNDGQWLVIDEFNRADIDRCFGELFSVLAGDAVELPFEEFIPSKEDSGKETNAEDREKGDWKRVRIVPAGQARREDSESVKYSDYFVERDFRLIGTMNDADRSQLYQLSYALQRRFDFIAIEAPEPRIVEAIINDRLASTHVRLDLNNFCYKLKVDGSHGQVIADDARNAWLTKTLGAKLNILFARKVEGEEGGRFSGFGDLVSERVVGIATVIDVVNFVLEGVRAPGKECMISGKRTDLKSSGVAEELVFSYLAMAVSLSVLPQLDALSAEPRRLEHAMRLIFDVFKGRQMRRIEIDESKKETDPPQFKISEDTSIQIDEFLARELSRQFRGLHQFENLIQEARRAGEGG